jgi:hypothetical protein
MTAGVRRRSSTDGLPGIAVTADGRVVVELPEGPGGEMFYGRVLRGAARRRVLARMLEAALEAAATELGRQRGRARERTSSRRGA